MQTVRLFEKLNTAEVEMKVLVIINVFYCLLLNALQLKRWVL